MRGVIRSYVEEKSYGFIDGEDGQSYYFHQNETDTSQGQIRIGSVVGFDPTPAKRGLKAKKVVVSQARGVLYVEPETFVSSKTSTASGYVTYHVLDEIETEHKTSPDEARNEIVEICATLGANAVLNLAYKRATSQSGNYVYSTHAFSGRPAIIAREVPTDNMEAIQGSAKRMNDLRDRSLVMYDKYMRFLEKDRRQREKLSRIYGSLAVIAVVVFFLILLFAYLS